jgi:acetone carboxylase gamma subunit
LSKVRVTKVGECGAEGGIEAAAPVAGIVKDFETTSGPTLGEVPGGSSGEL